MKFGSSKLLALGILPLLLSLNACGPLSSKSSAKKTTKTNPIKETNTQSQTPIPTSEAPVTPICAENQKSIGANIAFLIDNSSSNSGTDCPSPSKVGQYGGTDVFSCGAETSREKAVLAAYDLLADVSARDTSPMAASNISIVGFPAANNAVQTVQVATNGWVSTRPGAENRTGIQTALKFTRQPMGATPYGTAVAAANGLFSINSNDGRSRLAVLVTDGEPTDRDPSEVAVRAKALRDAGVEVITVFISTQQSRSQREAAHQAMLQSWEQQSQPNHYYNAQRYQSFDAYLNDVFGRNGRVSLSDSITSQVVPTCVDGAGSLCQRWKVEIPDAAGLSNVVKQIIRTRAVKCL